MTLADLSKVYDLSPQMTEAINVAIQDNGPMARATISHGIPSHQRRSKCFQAAFAAGFKEYRIYPGQRLLYGVKNYRNIIVEITDDATGN